MSESSTYPLRLPRSVKAAAEKLAREEGIGMIQFVATAVAEKLSAMSTATFFAERQGRADLAVFRRLLKRKGSQAPARRRRALNRRAAAAGRLQAPFFKFATSAMSCSSLAMSATAVRRSTRDRH